MVAGALVVSGIAPNDFVARLVPPNRRGSSFTAAIVAGAYHRSAAGICENKSMKT